MKELTNAAGCLIILAALRCIGVEDTNVVALGDWSETVANQYGTSVRGRLLMCEYPDHRSTVARSDLGVFVELQEYSSSTGGQVHLYCDFTKDLKCNITDAIGRPPEPVGGGWTGGAPGPQWVTLPAFSSIRLRASAFAGGRLRDGSLGLWFAGAGNWTIKPSDTNHYFLSGTFTSVPGNNTNNFPHTEIWSGTLNLPKMKVPTNTR